VFVLTVAEAAVEGCSVYMIHLFLATVLRLFLEILRKSLRRGDDGVTLLVLRRFGRLKLTACQVHTGSIGN